MSNQKAIKQFANNQISIDWDSYQFNSRNINYLKIANPNREVPVAIYIHGSPGSSKDFFNTMKNPKLRDSFELVCVDRPGFGYSEFGNGEQSLDTQAACISPLLEMYKGRKIIMIGHSYGGPVVSRIAMKYPELVAGLMIVAGSIDPDLEPEEKWRKPLNKKWVRWMLPRAMVASNQEIIALKSELQAIEQDWGLIKCPTLVLQGTKDKLVPPGNADYADEKIKDVPFKKIYKLEGINHFIPFNYEHFIIDALLEMKNVI